MFRVGDEEQYNTPPVQSANAISSDNIYTILKELQDQVKKLGEENKSLKGPAINLPLHRRPHFPIVQSIPILAARINATASHVGAALIGGRTATKKAVTRMMLYSIIGWVAMMITTYQQEVDF